MTHQAHEIETTVTHHVKNVSEHDKKKKRSFFQFGKRTKRSFFQFGKKTKRYFFQFDKKTRGLSSSLIISLYIAVYVRRKPSYFVSGWLAVKGTLQLLN